MAIKAYLFVDQDCQERCVHARETVKKYLETGEIVEMDVAEGVRKFNLGEPAGTPFIGIIAESTKECITQVYFNPPGEKDVEGMTEEEIDAEVETIEAENAGSKK